MQNLYVHDRRARPTLRVLKDDLQSGWSQATAKRALAEDRLEDLCPLAELPHPLILKASEWFGSDPAGDNYHQSIRCAAALGLLEVQSGQWRGAVWEDPDGRVRWLVAAGLAKGEHEDGDDFYVQLERRFGSNRQEVLLPTDADYRLLKLESANALIRSWELGLQEQVAIALADIAVGGATVLEVQHPTKDTLLATVEVELGIEAGNGYSYEAFLLTVDIEASYRSSNLAWTMTLRLLTCIYPPAQEWDRFGDTLSMMAEVGHAAHQAEVLDELTRRGELCRSAPGTVSHWTHKQNLAENSVKGKAVRAMCGVFFVPYQDHEKLPQCPECAEVRSLMPT
jgi:hypothetical protein